MFCFLGLLATESDREGSIDLLRLLFHVYAIVDHRFLALMDFYAFLFYDHLFTDFLSIASSIEFCIHHWFQTLFQIKISMDFLVIKWFDFLKWFQIVFYYKYVYETFYYIRKRNLIKRFNGIKDYDPLLPLLRLIIGLLRLNLFYDDFRVESSLVHKYPRRASGYGTWSSTPIIINLLWFSLSSIYERSVFF